MMEDLLVEGGGVLAAGGLGHDGHGGRLVQAEDGPGRGEAAAPGPGVLDTLVDAVGGGKVSGLVGKKGTNGDSINSARVRQNFKRKLEKDTDQQSNQIATHWVAASKWGSSSVVLDMVMVPLATVLGIVLSFAGLRKESTSVPNNEIVDLVGLAKGDDEVVVSSGDVLSKLSKLSLALRKLV